MKETDRQRQTGKRDIQRQIYVDTETDIETENPNWNAKPYFTRIVI